MTPDELIEDFKVVFPTRGFAAGLLLAFIDFLRELGGFERGYSDFDGFLADFPLVELDARRKQRNTLFVAVAVEGKPEPRIVGIRPAYNRAERYFREEHWRFDYPNCAPHATGQWRDHRAWLDALVTFTSDQAREVEGAVRAHVLATLASHQIDPAQLRPLERHFTRVLEEFDFTRHDGEPRGAPFQGVIYAYIRADAPHLHLQTSKVGAGSKRLGRYGDIDGWDGKRLVLSVEVKHYNIGVGELGEVEPFLATVSPLNAMPIIAATSFSEAARERVAAFGGRMLDLETLLDLVGLWDPLKQLAALQAFVYYVHRIQQNTALMDRLASFLESPAGEEDDGRQAPGEA